jgi:hypothetical protein
MVLAQKVVDETQRGQYIPVFLRSATIKMLREIGINKTWEAQADSKAFVFRILVYI